MACVFIENVQFIPAYMSANTHTGTQEHYVTIRIGSGVMSL